jgi:hypothetical protein
MKLLIKKRCMPVVMEMVATTPRRGSPRGRQRCRREAPTR